MKINDAVFGAVLLLLGVAILWHVQSFPRIPGQQVGPALFPGLVAAVLAGCGVLLIASGLRERAGGRWFELSDWTSSSQHLIAVAAIVAGTVAYILWVDDIGFLLLAPVLLFVWFIALKVRPLTAAATALIVTLLIWYSFYKMLRVPLPWGVLTPFAF